MPRFNRYIGVRYSGRKTATDAIPELRVFAAVEDHEPFEEFDTGNDDGQWSRRDLAEWLAAQLAGDEPVVVGLDHAFSLPRSYMDRNGVATWDEFIGAFAEHWPSQDSSVTDLLLGNLRRGGSEERRLTGKWASAQTGGVFRFDSKDGFADSTHAGIPWLGYLRRAAADAHIWPFDGFDVAQGRSLLAEARPAGLLLRYPRDGLSKEEQEAFALCAWLQDRDRNDLLAPYLSPPLTETESERARLEGWILGVM